MSVTIYNGYCSLAELKDWLTPSIGADTSGDDRMSIAINAASRAIDDHCGRVFFNTATSGGDTRYATASDASMLLERDLGIDILSLTSLSTDEDGDRTYERSWTTGDYDLEPYNAAESHRPYTRIGVAPNGDYSFPVGISKGVKLVGVFGYCTTSGQDQWAGAVKGACLIQASRFYARAVSPMGVAGGGAFGEMQIQGKLDVDVALMLQPLMRGLVG